MANDMDPEAVADVFREHDVERAPDARLQSTADKDVERVLPRIKPGPEPPSGLAKVRTRSRGFREHSITEHFGEGQADYLFQCLNS